MILSILTTVMLFLSSTSYATRLGTCPLDVGETTNTCEVEQLEVETAMIGLSVYRQYNYCRIPSLDRPDGVGLQCRTLTLYKDSDGNITKDYFKFQFTAAETHRSLFVDTYYVKRKDGKYNSYHDEIADQSFIIDNQKLEWRGVEVSFDGDFPYYTTLFITPSGSPDIADVVRTATITYTEDVVTVVNDSDRPVSEQSSIVYDAVGPYQVPKK